MIICKGEFGSSKCVIEMDAQDSDGGNVCCDMAEDLEFCKEAILSNCKHAIDDGRYCGCCSRNPDNDPDNPLLEDLYYNETELKKRGATW